LELNYPSYSVEDAENLGVENLRGGAMRVSAGNTEQVMGGGVTRNNSDSLLKVCNENHGGVGPLIHRGDSKRTSAEVI